jgi:hypothetical protein
MKNRMPHLALGLASLMVLCSTRAASAQEVERKTVTEKGGPSHGMLYSGIVVGGISYGAAAVVAMTSNVDADRRLIVPIAGPWLALSGRPACGGLTQPSCDSTTTDKVLIVTDGVFQAVGALLIVGAFLNPRTTTVTTAKEPPVRVAPTSVAGGGYGLVAFGNF